jgi:hypothetical protein
MRKGILVTLLALFTVFAMVGMVSCGGDDGPGPGPTPKDITITFNGNGGTATVSDVPDPVVIKENTSMGVKFPIGQPSRSDGATFLGWFKTQANANAATASNSAGAVTAATTFGATTTIYAGWQPLPSVPDGKFRIIFNWGSGGAPDDWTGTGANYLDFDDNTAVGSTLWPVMVSRTTYDTNNVIDPIGDGDEDDPHPVYMGILSFEFLGWGKDSANVAYDETYVFNSETIGSDTITLTAGWDRIRVGPYIRTFSANTTKIEVNQTTTLPRISISAISGLNASITYTWYYTTEPIDDPTEEKIKDEARFIKTGMAPADQFVQMNKDDFDITELGSYYFYVILWCDADNLQSQHTITEDPVQIDVVKTFVPTVQTVEKVSVRNSSIPLYKFTLPDGHTWAEYPSISIDYFVAGDVTGVARSRVYGSYLEGDIQTTGISETYVYVTGMINFNANPDSHSLNPNNSYILDNAGGNSYTIEKRDEWYTQKYKIDGTTGHGDLSQTVIPKNRDSATVKTLFMGPALITGGGNTTDVPIYYVRYVYLEHASDSDLNIEASNLGGGEWAINSGSSTGGGVHRRVYTGNVPDAPFVCNCESTNPHVCNCVAETGKACACYDCLECFPLCTCTGPDDCTCRAEVNCECTGCVNAYLAKIEEMKLLNSIAQAGGDAVDVDDSGVITMRGSYDDYLFFDFPAALGLTNTDFGAGSTVELIVAYQYAIDPRGRIGGAQVTTKAGSDDPGKDLPLGEGTNTQYPTLSASGAGTITLPLKYWPADAPNKDGVTFQNGSGRKTIAMVITSVTIKPPPAGDAPTKITFGTSDTLVKIVANGTNAKPGTIDYDNGAYIYDRNAGGYGNQVAYFTINFGTAKLSDYTDIKFKIKTEPGNNGGTAATDGDAGGKVIYVLANEDFAAAGPIGWTDGQLYSGAGDAVSMTIAQSPDNINAADYTFNASIIGAKAAAFDTKSTLDFAVYMHAAGRQKITVSDFEFVLPGGELGVTFSSSATVVTPLPTGTGSVAYEGDGSGYTFTRGAGYGGNSAWFTLSLGDASAKLSDYASVKVTVTLTGDAGWKRIGLLASAVANMATTASGINGNDDAIVTASVTPVTEQSGTPPEDKDFYGTNYNFTAGTAQDFTLTIDPTKAGALTGNELAFCFYCHGSDAQVLKITNVKFVK